MEDEDVPLNVLFERVWTTYEDADAEQAKEAIRWLQAAIARASALGIFSSNEEVDDIATADLKYLLLPYMQGFLLSDTRETEPQKRLAALEDASSHLTRFLEAVNRFKALSMEQQGALGGALSPGERLDAATKRAHKIRRFQLERAVRAELDALRMQEMRSRRLKQMQQESEDTSEREGGSEDTERETWLKQIALASLKAADRLLSIHQETEVLRHAVLLPEGVRSAQVPDRAPPPDVMTALHQAAAALSANPAEQMRASVFRPSHILPTRTLAEQAEMEMAAAQRASEAQARTEARRAAAKSADADGEQETLRQRAWDDWKDEHPRGAGNAKLRPTA